MAKSIASQLQALEKEITLKSEKYQEQLNKTPKEKWFTKEFMRSIHFSISIQELFNKAGVDISHIDNLSDEECLKLQSQIPAKYKSWSDFLKEAFAFNVKQYLSNL